MTQAIIFDWHGVLDKQKFSNVIYMISVIKELEVKQIRESLSKDGQDYAVGKLTPDQFWTKVSQDYGLENGHLDEIKNLLLTVNKNEELWNLLPVLKSKYRLAILSDCPEDKTKVIRDSIDLSYFEKTYFSSETRLLKSDPEFFDLAVAGLNLPAGECMFVDDSERNIIYAEAAGMQTHHYNGDSDVRELLLRI